jgi:hypothetical protein
LKGRPEIARAADAPSIAGISGSTRGFSDFTVAMICTSVA